MNIRCKLGNHEPVRMFNKIFLDPKHKGKEYYECERCGAPMVKRQTIHSKQSKSETK